MDAQPRHDAVSGKELLTPTRVRRSMNVFLAGGTGAIGRLLVPMLVEAGHEVVGVTRSAERAPQLERWAQRRWSAMCSTRRGSRDLVAEAEAETSSTSSPRSARRTAIRWRRRSACASRARAISSRRRSRRGRSGSSRRAFRSSARRPGGAHGRRDAVVPRRAAGAAAAGGGGRGARAADAGGEGHEGHRAALRLVLRPGHELRPGDAIPRAIRKGRMPIVGEGAGTYSFIHLETPRWRR